MTTKTLNELTEEELDMVRAVVLETTVLKTGRSVYQKGELVHTLAKKAKVVGNASVGIKVRLFSSSMHFRTMKNQTRLHIVPNDGQDRFNYEQIIGVI